jgi:uncharacterized repeat protein (TIGR02543 family)
MVQELHILVELYFQMGNTDVVLFAQWTTMPVYKVVYNGNGHTGGDVPVDSNNYLLSAKVTVKDNSGSLSKSGATFIGWNTAADGSGTAYAAGVSFAMGSADVILYAQWTNARYTVTFNSMEGSAVASQTIDHGGKVTEPAIPVKTGYTFGGWIKEAAYTTHKWNFTTETLTASDILLCERVCSYLYVTFDDMIATTQCFACIKNGNVPINDCRTLPSVPCKSSEISFCCWNYSCR